ncbi:(d)CMP kinase [Flavobacterium sp. CS20]|jgi:cytidylate kinase|uniref:(d)CMP kinase n=1 Tax=Flavobacterium sp. CS20 TaxID=2775246 RepID=UPI001B3A21D2|nr:(d)CMP kinase [Flavobacterium sp. CS20]QTY27490.1 (d)CMP kinase [Flavobacterium sp. CS20]
MTKTQVIAIDGYSSTGKSTVAKQLAQHLKFVYVDSGAMYRTITLFALENHCFENGKLNASKLMAQLDDIDIDFKFDNNSQNSTILLNQTNVEKNIRGMQVSNYVSYVAELPEVRQKLVELQRKMSKEHNLVMDGRDIGSVVFPDADIKFFMTASAEERAKRRFDELQQKGEQITFEEVYQNIQKRDQIDTTRQHSPLIQAKDAIVIDNTNLTKEEQFELMLLKISERINL